MMEGLKVRTASIQYILLGLLAVFISCNGQKKPAMESDKEGGIDELTLVLQDNYAATDSAETLVVRDEATLRKFFSKINRTRKPGIPLPEVDFSKEMVIIYCAGLQSGGVVPSLTMLAETEAGMVMGLEQKKIKGDKVSTASISPFSVYKMPVTKKEITFKAVQ